jgi:predicted TIM-barrel fold metal-dependent hydrolase
MNFQIFDSHLHTAGTWLSKDKDFLTYMDENNIKKAILTTINRAAKSKIFTKKNSKIGINKAMENLRAMLPKTQLNHQDVLDIASKDPDRFIKFFWFNPNIDEEFKEESYQILKEHFDRGFSGVKIHSGINLVKIPGDIITLVEFMQEYNSNFSLFMHSTPKTSYFEGITVNDIAKLSAKFPELTIIIGHAGCSMEYAIDLGLMLKQYDNIYFETSCSIPYAILSLIKTIGHKRIIFGSDAPVSAPLSLEIEKITCLPIPNQHKQDILYNNVNMLFE